MCLFCDANLDWYSSSVSGYLCNKIIENNVNGTDINVNPNININAFVDAINSDPFAYFSASAPGGDVVRITADSALAGQLFVETNVPGITAAMITQSTAWVAPVGTVTEVLRYINNTAIVTGPVYDRYIILHRQVIRHNAVSGLGVIRNATSLVYLKSTDAGTGTTVTKLTSILDGSYATVADYLGCPAV